LLTGQQQQQQQQQQWGYNIGSRQATQARHVLAHFTSAPRAASSLT